MKKHYLISGIFLLIASCKMNAQVVNGTFENVKPNFLPSNWGMTFLQAFGFDPETGEPIGNQIQFTWCFPSMVYASTEAKTGAYAMEISNAYNVTTDTVIPGVATLFNDPEQDGPGWNPGVPVSMDSSIIMLGFDYKFMPAGNDVAQATLQVIDESGNELGHASVDISGTHNEYEYIYTPLSITHAGTPAFMYISFSMAKPGSTPTFGSRLIVDNVIVNFSSLISSENSESQVQVFPTLADNELNIIPKGFTDTIAYKVINTEGKIVKQANITQNPDYIYTMDVEGLSPGVYFLNMHDEGHDSTKKFIKK